MKRNFIGCAAYVYDTEGVLQTEVKIYDHDSEANIIKVSNSLVLSVNMRCELLILSLPAPFSCSGVVRSTGSDTIITLFKGKERENRRNARYALSCNAKISEYICEGKAYRLHTPITVNLMNISTNGIRIRARYNTLSADDLFNLQLKMGEREKVLTAKVVNLKDNERESSEYGCALTEVDDSDQN